MAAAFGRAVPCSGQHGDSKAVEGECGLSRSERKLGDAAARQWLHCLRATGGAVHTCNDERTDGLFDELSKQRIVDCFGRRSVAGSKRLVKRSLGGLLFTGGELVADTRRALCARLWAAFGSMTSGSMNLLV